MGRRETATISLSSSSPLSDRLHMASTLLSSVPSLDFRPFSITSTYHLLGLTRKKAMTLSEVDLSFFDREARRLLTYSSCKRLVRRRRDYWRPAHLGIVEQAWPEADNTGDMRCLRGVSCHSRRLGPYRHVSCRPLLEWCWRGHDAGICAHLSIGAVSSQATW